MRHRTLPLLLFAALISWTSAQAAGDTFEVQVQHISVEGGQVTVAFDLKNNSGGETPDLKPQDIKIIENDKNDTPIPIDDSTLDPQHTDENHPTVTITPNQGAPLEISASSATIGIVFDAVIDQTKDFDTAVAGWQVIRRFLCPSDCRSEIRTKVPNNREGIGLFIPPKNQGGPIEQPRMFKEFPKDMKTRADLLNFLTNRLKVRRAPPTSLFETLRTAVNATADQAAERGGPALVLMVSNSSEQDISDLAKATEVAKLAQDRRVGVVTFRIAKEDNVDKEFLNLFSATQENGGMAETIRVDPTKDDTFNEHIADMFDQAVLFTPVKLYTVHYTTNLPPDGQPNSLRVRIDRGQEAVTSEPMKFVVQGRHYELKGLAETLISGYLLLAIPATLLTALLIIVLTAAMRWSRTRSAGV